MAENFRSWTRYGARKANSPGNRLLAVACLVTIIGCPVAAKTPSEPGPTASASIRIAVSVARRYGLATGGSSGLQDLAQSPRNPFCLASNGGEMLMPVQLIYSSPSQADEGGSPDGKGTARLLPCGSSNHMLDAADALEGVAGLRAVIVSPE